MKSLLSVKQRQAIFFSFIFITSFIVSKKYTDPFFVPKNFFFFFSSAVFISMTCFVYYSRQFTTRLTFSWQDVTIAGFILFSFIRLIFTPGMSADNVKFYLLFINGLLYFLIKPFLFETDKKDHTLPVVTIVNILLIIALIQVCWGFLQYLDIKPNLDGQFKIGGSFSNPGQYTNFIAPLLSFALAVFFFSKKNKTLGLLASIAILVILPFTQARTAWIGALLVVLYLADKRYLILKRFFGFIKSTVLRIVIVIFIATLVVISGYYTYNLKKNSSSGRLFIWQVSATMIKENPVWGYGYDRFAAAHNDYQAQYFKNHPNDSKNAEVADGVNYAFNEFIQVAVETGIIGLILLLLLFFFAFRTKTEKPETGEENLYFYAAKGSMMAIFISMLFSYPLHIIPSLTLLFFSLAIVSALNKQKILFEFTLSPKTRKGASVLGLIIIVCFSVVQFRRNDAEREWLKAYQMMRKDQLDEAYNLYRDLYPTMAYNQYFLFNYGSELSLMKRYDESTAILKEAELRLNDSDFYIYLGSSYENKGNIAAAEQCYLKASYVMPLKFFPKYMLVGIYRKTNREKEALLLAKSLLTMPVKVSSQIITDIKQEMREFVNRSPASPQAL